jgi:hypothetical protein
LKQQFLQGKEQQCCFEKSLFDWFFDVVSVFEDFFLNFWYDSQKLMCRRVLIQNQQYYHD